MKIALSLTVAALILTGCATPDYTKQLTAYRDVETERAKADSEKYRALASITTGAGDSTKQVALQAWQAVAMSETLGSAAGKARAAEMPQPQPSAFDRTLHVLTALAPVAANVYGAYYNNRLGMAQTASSERIATGDQRARVDSLFAVSAGNASIAGAGFASVGSIATAGVNSLATLAAKPTSVISVTGDHNAVASIGSTATTTKNCTTGGTAPGGNGGTSGASGNGGNGAPGTTTGGAATGGNGAGSGATAPTGQGGQSGPTGSNGC